MKWNEVQQFVDINSFTIIYNRSAHMDQDNSVIIDSNEQTLQACVVFIIFTSSHIPKTISCS